MEGNIFSVQRFSLHDGPGIRTTVFLQGCPLHCSWCHNPEGKSSVPMLAFYEEKCTGCGACKRCPQKAHQFEGNIHRLWRQRCIGCGLCAEYCAAGALVLYGRRASVAQVLDEVARDAPFFRESGGGMTLSGGEPMAQPAFALALARGAGQRGIETCLETSGNCSTRDLLAIAPHVQCFYYDIKQCDSAQHRQHTGAGNEKLLQNLHALHRQGACIVLRCPIIPGVNAEQAHFRAIAALLATLPRINEVHLMGYHPLGGDKAAALGMAPFGVTTTLPQQQMQEWAVFLQRLTTARVLVP